ncbi:hypothetical protein NL108_004152, partial [Boleophthalmus pectinirostris]
MLGLDTLEEAQEKEKFFTELEAGASSTIDYSKLNKDLDSASSTTGTTNTTITTTSTTITVTYYSVTTVSCCCYCYHCCFCNHLSLFCCFQTAELSALEDLKAQLLEKEKLIQKLKQDLEEVDALKQHNYLLQSKLRSAEEALQKNRLTDASDSRHQDKLQQIDKEMKVQETLIQGYQQENERLYQQMKAQQARSKANEDVMFKENQRLLSELASTRSRLTYWLLRDQIRDLTRDQTKDQDQGRTRDQQQDQNQMREHVQDHEIVLRVMKQKHQEEVTELKKRLNWFTENQELLDRDAARLRAATEEILQLKEQVKELEQILRSRNPNSLPALIFAAASAQHPTHSSSDPAHPSFDPASSSLPSRVTVLLERRVQRLEAELEAHDEEAKRSLRAMEQQFQAIRMRYEQQIAELEQQLEQQLEQKHQKEQGSDPELVQGLREELKRERDAHRQKETTLQSQLNDLQQQLKLKVRQVPSRHQRQADAAFGLRIERLNHELSTKSRTIQDLTRTVERLQRERRSMLSVPVPRAEGWAANERRQAAANKPAPDPDVTKEMFPALSVCEKTYQPTVFTDSHVSEVQQENAALKLKLQQIQSDSEREREELKTALSQTQEQINRLQEEHAQQLSSLQAQSIKEQAQLRSTFALEHSASAVAQLTNQLHAQQIVVQQLQEQLSEAQSWKQALNVSRAREEALQTQLSRCLEDLKEARDNQSPEVKLLWSLEKKVQNMKTRQQHRDRELQQ